MHTNYQLLASMLVGLFLAVAPSASQAGDGIAGKWKATSVTCSGAACEVAEGLQCQFTADSVVAQYGENKITVGYKLQTDQPIKQLTIVIGGSVSWKGIYNQAGDKLTICVVSATGELPSEFVTREGDGRVLLEMERAK